MDKSIFNQENYSQISYYAYSYRTEEVIKLPVEPNNNKPMTLLIGNVFTYVQYDKEQISISRYELDTRAFQTQYIAFTAEELGLLSFTNIMWLEGNHLFITDRNYKVPTVVAILSREFIR